MWKSRPEVDMAKSLKNMSTVITNMHIDDIKGILTRQMVLSVCITQLP